MNKYRKLAILPLLLLALASAACERQTISRILADPARYHDKDVGIVGKVDKSFSVLNYGFYEIDDGTGRMYVVTRRGAPARGSRVGARGKVNNYFSFAGQNYGTVLMEEDRRAR